MTSLLFAGFVLMTLMPGAISYQSYQQQIPNGDKVQSPCNTSSIWGGVGHQNPMGGGNRNQFGLDFAANNHVWNAALCQKDSDGDGLTNGYELGDPNCTWSTGQTPSRTMNITHPGVCQPMSSMNCMSKNSWLMCSNTTFNCSAIKDPSVKNFTMRFPVTPVPTNETTYICNRFLYPNDSIADIIAIEPVVDNLAIIHHMLLFGCTDNPTDVPTNGPYMCGMGSMSCNSLLGLWGFGAAGQCLNNQMGFRIGPGGFQYAVLQIHWNNPMHRANLTDSSGMRLYYTNQLRPNRGEILMVGQQVINIPPGKSNVTVVGNCSGSCTSAVLGQSVYLTSAVLHMHLLGNSGIIKLYRNGQLLKVLDQVDHYDYNTPTLTEFETPVELKPGDSVSVKCVFNSTGKATTTTWGEGTSDEMCYGFFAYYPQNKNFSFCGQTTSINICTKSGLLTSDFCDFTTFRKYMSMLSTYCYTNCSNSTCVNVINGALDTGCSRNDDARNFMYAMMPDQLKLLGYCSIALPPKVCSDSTAAPGLNQVANGAGVLSSLQGVYFGSALLIGLALINIRRSF